MLTAIFSDREIPVRSSLCVLILPGGRIEGDDSVSWDGEMFALQLDNRFFALAPDQIDWDGL